MSHDKYTIIWPGEAEKIVYAPWEQINGSEVYNVGVQRNEKSNWLYFKFVLLILILRVDLVFYSII